MGAELMLQLSGISLVIKASAGTPLKFEEVGHGVVNHHDSPDLDQLFKWIARRFEQRPRQR